MPQQTVSKAYCTVLIPMDDGNWHVTVYCPASLDGPLLDKDSNEFDTDDVKPGDKSYTVANPFHLNHAPGTDAFTSALTPSDDSDGLTIQPHA